MILQTEKSHEIRRQYILQEALFSAYVAYQTEFCKRENERRVEAEKKELEEKDSSKRGKGSRSYKRKERCNEAT